MENCVYLSCDRPTRLRPSTLNNWSPAAKRPSCKQTHTHIQQSESLCLFSLTIFCHGSTFYEYAYHISCSAFDDRLDVDAQLLLTGTLQRQKQTVCEPMNQQKTFQNTFHILSFQQGKEIKEVHKQHTNKCASIKRINKIYNYHYTTRIVK